MSTRTPFIGGNWKMNYGPSETRAFVESFVRIHAPADDRTVVFFPPALSLAEFRDAASKRPDLLLGVQDIHWEKSGAFTGALSAGMAEDAGASFVLAGHSERRHVFGDDDEDVARKVEAIADAGLVPVLCLGETLEEREADRVEEVVKRQLSKGLSRLEDDDAVSSVIVAYEPVWAIGTGKTASPEDASSVHGLIRGLLADRVGKGAAGQIPIIYGGSVKPVNVDELLAADDVDGGLVGGASLEPEDFAAVCAAAGR